MKKIYIVLFFMMFAMTSWAQETVQLKWTKSTDNIKVTGYNIWLEDELYKTTVDTFLVLDLEPGTYSFKVSAFDAEGNESSKSAPNVIKVADTIIPTTPENLQIIKKDFALKPEDENLV